MIRVAIFGSLEPSKQSISVAKNISKTLSKHNIEIVTGGCIGIAEHIIKEFRGKKSTALCPLSKNQDIVYPTLSTNGYNKIIDTSIYYNLLSSEILENSNAECEFKFRNFLTTLYCDCAIAIEGNLGTFTEISNIIALRKPLLLIKYCGGISAYFANSSDLFSSSNNLLISENEDDLSNSISLLIESTK